MDDVERLRRFCVDDPRLAAETGGHRSSVLDARTGALVRIAALIASSAPAASMRSAIDEAGASGVSLCEIMAVLDSIVGDVGRPRAVAAAPRIAAALGYADDLVPETGI